MINYISLRLCFLIAILTIFGAISYADENTCLSCYEKMVVAMENMRSKADAGDYCGTADYIEIALNWIGTCEKVCSHNDSVMKQLAVYKTQLTELLAVYVKKCGH